MKTLKQKFIDVLEKHYTKLNIDVIDQEKTRVVSELLSVYKSSWYMQLNRQGRKIE